MLTDKQLEFVLGEIQNIQKKVFGTDIGITITTGCNTREFVVIVDYDYEKFEDGNCNAFEEEFEFVKTLTEDQCVDLLQNIENLIKEKSKC